MQIFIV